MFLALESLSRAGVVILMTLNTAPAGSAMTAMRPGSMSIGPCITAPPFALAVSAVWSESSTAK